MKKDKVRFFTNKDIGRKLLETNCICEVCRLMPIHAFHHIKPHSKGGRTIYENMAGVCQFCHIILDSFYPNKKSFEEYKKHGGVVGILVDKVIAHMGVKILNDDGVQEIRKRLKDMNSVIEFRQNDIYKQQELRMTQFYVNEKKEMIFEPIEQVKFLREKYGKYIDKARLEKNT